MCLRQPAASGRVTSRRYSFLGEQKMAKIRVGVIFSGRSAEHEVSLQSAKNIVDAIDRKRFDVVLLGIDKQGSWYLHDAANYLLHGDDPSRIALIGSTREIALLPGRRQHPVRAG